MSETDVQTSEEPTADAVEATPQADADTDAGAADVAAEAPADDAPAAEALADDAPAAEAPADDAPVAQAPADDAPVAEAPPVDESAPNPADFGDYGGGADTAAPAAPDLAADDGAAEPGVADPAAAGDDDSASSTDTAMADAVHDRAEELTAPDSSTTIAVENEADPIAMAEEHLADVDLDEQRATVDKLTNDVL